MLSWHKHASVMLVSRVIGISVVVFTAHIALRPLHSRQFILNGVCAMPLSRAVATEGACSQDKTMISRLAHLPWFAGLPAELLTHIARHGTELSLADQQVLFLKDSPAQYLALVLSGQVYHLLHNQDGRELIIDRSQVGDWVGESALLEGHDRRDCTAVADGATRVWLLPRAQFGPLTGNPEFLRRMFASVCRRMRTHTEHVETLCLHQLGPRLARHLLRMVDEQPHAASVPGVWLHPPKQSVLASMVNVSRPKLNAQLRNWQRNGLIHHQPNILHILDVEKLRRIAYGECDM
jgi:CRP-like cAMP-binding protein